MPLVNLNKEDDAMVLVKQMIFGKRKTYILTVDGYKANDIYRNIS